MANNVRYNFWVSLEKARDIQSFELDIIILQIEAKKLWLQVVNK